MRGVFRSDEVFRAGPGRRDRFALLDRPTLEDPSLSWKATGIWATLMSRTDDWKTRVQWLVNISTDGEGAVRSGLKELERAGLLLRRQRKQADNRFGPVEYLILGASAELVLSPGEIESWLSGADAGVEDESGIIRVDRRLDRRFAQIDVGGLVNPALSFKAKGLWCFLMSRPADWETPMRALVNAKRDGRDSVYSGVSELIEAEYIVRPDQERKEDGTFAPVIYWFFEKPLEELRREAKELLNWNGGEPLRKNPDAVNQEPLSENPDAVNQEPLSENPDAVTKTTQAIENAPLRKNPEAVKTPRPGFPKAEIREAGNREAENEGILRNIELKKIKPKKIDTYSPGELQAEEEEKENRPGGPTDRLANIQSIEELWEKVAEAEWSDFLAMTLEFFGVEWSVPRRQIFGIEFAPFDSLMGRVWLVEKFERLAEFSDAGIYDMVSKDLKDPKRAPRRTTEVVSGRRETRAPEREQQPQPKERVTLEEPGAFWTIALDHLQTMVSSDVLEHQMKGLEPLGFDSLGVWRFEVLDPFTKVWIEDRYLDLVEAALRQAGALCSGVAIEVKGYYDVRRPGASGSATG